MSESDSIHPVEISAATLEEAIDKGLAQLGLSRNEVIIEIVQEESKGIAETGSREAIVRLTPLVAPRSAARRSPSTAVTAPAPEPEFATGFDAESYDDEEPYSYDADDESYDEDARIGREALEELLERMQIDATIRVYRADPADETDPPWILDIRGRDLGILIGRRGETLDALQYTTRLIVSRELQRRANIVLDVEGYKSRREQTLRKLALRMASQARKLGRTMTLEPMPPNERRIIHITLREDETVETESVGEGDRRKVTIIPIT